MSTVIIPFDILAGRPDLTNTPQLYQVAGTNFPNVGYAFPSGGTKALYLQLGAHLYGSGNITLDLHLMSATSQVSGNVNFVAALAAITAGDAQSVETKAFATSQNATATINTTAKGDTGLSITISNLDSVAAGDFVVIKLTRGTDTMSGDAVLLMPVVSYDDGGSGSPGSGDVVGPVSATDNAVPRYNLTTGKLLKNSPVTIDDSGNIAGLGTINGGALLPQIFASLSADSSAINTTSTVVLTLAVPAAGTWLFDFDVTEFNSTATGNVTNNTVNFTGTQSLIRAAMLAAITATTFAGPSTNTNNTALACTPSVTTDRLVRIKGTLICSTSGNLTLAIQRNTSGNITMRAGSSVIATKIA